MSSARNRNISSWQRSSLDRLKEPAEGRRTYPARLVVLLRAAWICAVQGPLFLATIVVLFLFCRGVQAQTAHSVGEEIPFGSGFENPHGIVVDAAGNLYIADYGSGHVYQETLQNDGTYIQTVLFPGSGYGSAIGLARDRFGNFYIAGNGVLTKETAQAIGGYSASTVGKFTHPVGVAVDPAGDVFVVDDNESSLYELVAGAYTQITLDPATLPTPYAVSIDSFGNLYVGTVRGPYIEKYTLNNGSYTKSNALNAPSTYGVIADNFGNLFYAGPAQFMKAVLANGSYSEEVYSDYRVQALTQGPDLALYAVSYFESTGVRLNTAPSFGSVPVGSTAPRQISIHFTVDTAGTFGTPTAVTQGTGSLDFSVASTTCSGALAAGTGCTVTVAFSPIVPGLRSGGINLVDASGDILASSPVSGLGIGPQGVIYPGTQTSLASGIGAGAVATDTAGNAYVGTSGGSILKETPTNGSYTQSTVGSGIGTLAAIAVDGSGNLFIADSARQQVVKENFQPVTGSYVQTVVFTAAANGLGQVGGAAVDGGGTVYLGNGSELLKEVPYGSGYVQGTVAAGFGQITALAVDGEGNVFVADAGTGSIYKETPVAGGAYTQTTVVAGLGTVSGLGVDAGGTLYVAAQGTNGVMRFATAGTGSQAFPSVVGAFANPGGIALDGAGNLYVEAALNGATGLPTLFRFDVADSQTLIFPLTAEGKSSAAQTVILANIGNAALTLSGLATSSANFSLDAATTTCAATGSVAVADGCVAGMSFTPQIAGPLTGTFNITDNTLNQAGAVQRVLLNAAGSGPVTVAVSDQSVVYGTAKVVLSASVSYAGTVAPSGALTFVVDQGTSVTATCSASGAVLNCAGTYPTAMLAVGLHTITATNAADTYYSAATGTGRLTITAPAVSDFSFTNAGTATATISSGASAVFNFQLTPMGVGFPGQVSLAVTGLPPQATYELTPSNVSAASGSQVVQLTIQTAAPVATKAANQPPSSPWAKGAVLLSAMLLPFGVARRHRWMNRSLTLALASLLSLAAVTGLAGCGFLGYAYQSPGNFAVTVTAVSGSVQHSATVKLTVQ